MAAAVTVSPASPVHAESACEVAASGLDVNDASTYDVNAIPSEDPISYYFKASATGQDDLVSPVFGASAEGDAEWHDLIFGAAGSWTVGVYLVSDDSEVASTSVTVS